MRILRQKLVAVSVLLPLLQLSFPSETHAFGRPRPRPTPTPSPTPVAYFNFAVEVFDSEIAAGRGVAGASVHVGADSRTTDGSGWSHFHVARGSHTITVSADGFEPYEFTHLVDREHAEAFPSENNPSFRLALTPVALPPPPSVRLTGRPDQHSPSRSPKFSWTASNGSAPLSFRCQMDSGAFEPCTSPKTYSGIPDGAHKFSVKAVDSRGRESNVDFDNFVVDTTAPEVRLTAAPSGVVSSSSARFEFWSQDSKSGIWEFRCKLDGGSESVCTSPVDLNGLSSGTHTFTIKVLDNAGNVSPPVATTWTVDTTPVPPGTIPAPNHPMTIGYYFADGRYGDYTSEVFPYTNLYVAGPGNYETTTDWRPQFQASIRRAGNAGKTIFLLPPPTDADWNEVLDIVAPFWNLVSVVEIAHEEDLTVAQAEARAASVFQRMDAKGLARKTLGVTLTQNQVLGVAPQTGAVLNAPSIGFIGIEAYVNPPGDHRSHVNIDGLNSFIDRAKARIPANKKIGMIVQAYDRNGQWSNIQTLTDLQLPPYLKSYNDPRVEMLLLFSYARPGGARQYNSLSNIHKRIGARIMGLPDPGDTCVGGPCVSKIPQDFILSRWSPPVANGWFPAISPDGRYVAYGFGETRLSDLVTRQTWDVELNRGFSAQWIRPDVLTWTRELAPGANDRFEMKMGEFIARKTADDPYQVGGSLFSADGGNWASWLAAGDFRLTWNNRQIASKQGGAISVSGNTLVNASDGEHSGINVWKNGLHAASYPALTPLHQMTVRNDYIVYGGYGAIYGITPSGQQVDLTASPNRMEGNGQVFFVNGQPWVASAAWGDNLGGEFVLLRPWGEKDSIVVRAGAATMHVVANGSTITIAYGTDRGTPEVITVPATAPRYPVRMP